MSYRKLTAETLKETLWHTLNQVKSGKLESSEAHAISAQSREIMRVVHSQVLIAKASQKELPAALKSFAGCDSLYKNKS